MAKSYVCEVEGGIHIGKNQYSLYLFDVFGTALKIACSCALVPLVTSHLKERRRVSINTFVFFLLGRVGELPGYRCLRSHLLPLCWSTTDYFEQHGTCSRF